ncbi:MAG: HigA family addiction module antidote protein [Cellulomonadaceae bacterium]|jgi:addiction module HigA family antidote|nr:HigA family addiction module antidote protein [Cellulomonadaceae bacterium]
MPDTDPISPQYDPPHPGEFIAATYLEPFNISARTLAGALGVAVTTVTRILSGQARVTPEMAVRLEGVLRGSAQMWLRMQDNYDLWQARQTVDVTPLRKLDLAAA